MNENKSKKQVVFLGVFVLLIVMIVAGYMAKSRTTGNVIITTGDRAPEFRVPAADGKTINLSDLRGKVVMVHFWATWCPPCVEEIPILDAVNRQMKGEGLEVLAISVDEGGAGAVLPFLQKNGLTLPVFFDPDHSIAGRYGTFKFPETYILDRQGIVRYKVIGPANWADASNIKALRELIAAK